MKQLRLVLERDEAGWWVASVPEVPGCLTQGRSIEQARRRIREALDACDVAPENVTLIEEIRLPAPARKLLRETAQARRKAELEQAKAQKQLHAAVQLLVRELGVSVRDAGALLGLSHQRIQQLVQSGS